MNIEALITSVQEPQLDKCLYSVRNQIVPFSNIIHINNVVPEAEAFKKGLGQVSQTWVMVIGGDIVLYDNATASALKKIEEYASSKIGGFLFGLLDPFVNRIINSCTVYRVEAVRSVQWCNALRNDRKAVQEMENKGWMFKRFWRGRRRVVIGTHFEDPDNFQIFRRFFVAGVKRNSSISLLEELYAKTGNEKYELAIKAIKYGRSKSSHFYPTSHNVEYDRQMFEEFKREDINYNTRAE